MICLLMVLRRLWNALRMMIKIYSLNVLMHILKEYRKHKRDLKLAERIKKNKYLPGIIASINKMEEKNERNRSQSSQCQQRRIYQ
jgi:hypothetical protein